MLGENEANIITEEQRNKIGAIVEGFVDDLVPKILDNPNDFSIKGNYSKRGEVSLEWEWKSRGIEQKKTIRRSPCVQTEEDFFHEIRSYLFSLCLTLANL